jgi:drug/metabolite transporter (DMT)-like permease
MSNTYSLSGSGSSGLPRADSLPYSAGIVLCLLATVSWGGMFPVMESALSRIDPFTFTALRYTIAAAVFALTLAAREGMGALRLRGERWMLAWMLGSAGFAGFGFLVFLGQQLAGRDGALTASIIMATQPMLGLLVAWVIRRVAPGPWSFVFILMSFTGVLLVITKGDITALAAAPANYSSDLLILIGALCWVCYTVGASFFPKWTAIKYTAITTLLGLTSVIAITALLYAVGTVHVPTTAAIVSVSPHFAYMALIAGFFGVLSWNLGNRIITPGNGVLFMDVVPLMTFVVSGLTGTIPSAWQIGGACLTAAALICNTVYAKYRLQRLDDRLDRLPLQRPVLQCR